MLQWPQIEKLAETADDPERLDVLLANGATLARLHLAIHTGVSKVQLAVRQRVHDLVGEWARAALADTTGATTVRFVTLMNDATPLFGQEGDMETVLGQVRASFTQPPVQPDEACAKLRWSLGIFLCRTQGQGQDPTAETTLQNAARAVLDVTRQGFLGRTALEAATAVNLALTAAGVDPQHARHRVLCNAALTVWSASPDRSDLMSAVELCGDNVPDAYHSAGEAPGPVSRFTNRPLTALTEARRVVPPGASWAQFAQPDSRQALFLPVWRVPGLYEHDDVRELVASHNQHLDGLPDRIAKRQRLTPKQDALDTLARDGPRYCGTFFYFERGGSWLLPLGTCRVFGGKPAAYFALFDEAARRGLVDVEACAAVRINDYPGELRSFVATRTKENKLVLPLPVEIFDYTTANRMAFPLSTARSPNPDEPIPSQLLEFTAELYRGDEPFLLRTAADDRAHGRLTVGPERPPPMYPSHPLGDRDNKPTPAQAGKCASFLSYYAPGYNRHFGIGADTRARFGSAIIWPQIVSSSGFDDFDEPICHLMRELAIDTVVFQHSVGGNRAVTEVMCSSRNAAASTVRAPQPVLEPARDTAGDRFPTVWFTGEGVVDRDGKPVCVSVDPTRGHVSPTCA